MAAQHTPGPWAVHPQRAWIVPADHVGRPIGGDADAAKDLRDFAQPICSLYWPGRHKSEDQVRADGNLIAAAIDLLIVCKDVEWSGDADRAEGGHEPACPQCGSARRFGHQPACSLAAAIAKAEGRAS